MRNIYLIRKNRIIRNQCICPFSSQKFDYTKKAIPAKISLKRRQYSLSSQLEDNIIISFKRCKNIQIVFKLRQTVLTHITLSPTGFARFLKGIVSMPAGQ